jgi:hypothetical protein
MGLFWLIGRGLFAGLDLVGTLFEWWIWMKREHGFEVKTAMNWFGGEVW